MAQEKPSRLADWVVAIRHHAPSVQRYVQEWLHACLQEPRLIWQTAAVRYATYLLAGLLVVSFARWAAEALTPPPPANARDRATTADFHVLCANPECKTHFVVNREFGFNGFPVECLKCGKPTGFAARLCNAPTCGARWVIPIADEGSPRCPRCTRPFD